MLFSHRGIKCLFLSIFLIISIAECTSSDSKIILHFNENDNLVPIINSLQYNQAAEDSISLVLFVEDAECPMCLAELLLWRDLIIRDQKRMIRYYFVFKNCHDVRLQYDLDMLGINENIYWDSKGILEEEIEINSLSNTIIVDRYFQVIKAFDRTLLSEDEIIGIIREVENM